MLYLYTGTDRGKAREMMQKAIERIAKKEKASIVRITDAHTLPDLATALQGGGMFGGAQVVVCENVLTNEEMAPVVLNVVPSFKESADAYFIFEEKIDAAMRKKLEKYAETSERCDAPKGFADKEAFALAQALQRRDKKTLWVGYMREIAKGAAPEMLHGILFWAAKQQLLRSRTIHNEALVAVLAELPHTARRKGFDFEYALEHFVLSRT